MWWISGSWHSGIGWQGRLWGIDLGDEDADDNEQGDGAGDIVQAPGASRSQQATDTQPRGNPGAKAKAKAKAKL